jgi:hypothetical protein
VIILGIVLAVLVMVLAALVSSAIKRHWLVQQINRNAETPVSVVRADSARADATRVTVRDLAREGIPAGSYSPAKVNAGTTN